MTARFPLQDGQAELPTLNSTHSYWHRDPSKKLLGHRTTESLPSTADVVVVGSGITGTFAARELVAGGRGVVMLDAREACWGATGRPQNGGHCQPGVWDSTPEVARFELATFNLIKKLVVEHEISCDWHVVGGVHAIFSHEVLEAARKQIKRLQQYPDLRDKAALILDKHELAAWHVPEAIAAVYQPNAAKCWPYKLVAWLLERLLGEHDAAAFNLQTNTPVEHLGRCGSSWIVHTRRGQILARDVLLATNGYTSRLLPKMTGLIVPLPHSYVWMKGADHQYLIHRGPEDILAVPGGEEGISRDDEVNPILSRALHTSLQHVWTGIMGYSRDCNPWVGRVPTTLVRGPDTESGTSGLWISAGYTGHGMPVAALCGVAVAEMMLGKADGVQVPGQWLSSDERAERAREAQFPNTVEELLAMLPAE
ncbi:FAD dependent oxidoreductase [Hirsutella rhossiliensis]|uniref:FAD dependent oxidoreductase domain-containing protein n=1 Tax=Hirsutella rhossiliensis TaxID=111463 RepID=A0A9P8N172_9HYPO|nr:FAD dependent oxidoreductase domain-containing protein [Hirsutella rhossiliensis]KAH0962862.1 FAD dependent oxidoreductase domain-containing protein [Hirsutella rhossiliensis]